MIPGVPAMPQVHWQCCHSVLPPRDTRQWERGTFSSPFARQTLQRVTAEAAAESKRKSLSTDLLIYVVFLALSS